MNQCFLKAQFPVHLGPYTFYPTHIQFDEHRNFLWAVSNNGKCVISCDEFHVFSYRKSLGEAVVEIFGIEEGLLVAQKDSVVFVEYGMVESTHKLKAGQIVTCACKHPASRDSAALGLDNGILTQFSLTRGQTLNEVQLGSGAGFGPRPKPTLLRSCPNGTGTTALALDDGTIQILDDKLNVVNTIMEVHRGLIDMQVQGNVLAVSTQQNLYAQYDEQFTAQDVKLKIYDLRRLGSAMTFRQFPKCRMPAQYIQWSPKLPNTLCINCTQGHFTTYDYNQGECGPEYSVGFYSDSITGCQVSPSGQLLACTNKSGYITMWALNSNADGGSPAVNKPQPLEYAPECATNVQPAQAFVVDQPSLYNVSSVHSSPKLNDNKVTYMSTSPTIINAQNTTPYGIAAYNAYGSFAPQAAMESPSQDAPSIVYTPRQIPDIIADNMTYREYIGIIQNLRYIKIKSAQSAESGEYDNGQLYEALRDNRISADIVETDCDSDHDESSVTQARGLHKSASQPQLPAMYQCSLSPFSGLQDSVDSPFVTHNKTIFGGLDNDLPIATANALLQVLFYTPALCTHIMRTPVSTQPTLTDELNYLFRFLLHQTCAIINPSNLYKILSPLLQSSPLKSLKALTIPLAHSTTASLSGQPTPPRSSRHNAALSRHESIPEPYATSSPDITSAPMLLASPVTLPTGCASQSVMTTSPSVSLVTSIDNGGVGFADVGLGKFSEWECSSVFGDVWRLMMSTIEGEMSGGGEWSDVCGVKHAAGNLMGFDDALGQSDGRHYHDSRHYHDKQYRQDGRMGRGHHRGGQYGGPHFNQAHTNVQAMFHSYAVCLAYDAYSNANDTANYYYNSNQKNGQRASASQRYASGSGNYQYANAQLGRSSRSKVVQAMGSSLNKLYGHKSKRESYNQGNLHGHGRFSNRNGNQNAHAWNEPPMKLPTVLTFDTNITSYSDFQHWVVVQDKGSESDVGNGKGGAGGKQANQGSGKQGSAMRGQHNGVQGKGERQGQEQNSSHVCAIDLPCILHVHTVVGPGRQGQHEVVVDTFDNVDAAQQAKASRQRTSSSHVHQQHKHKVGNNDSQALNAVYELSAVVFSIHSTPPHSFNSVMHAGAASIPHAVSCVKVRKEYTSARKQQIEKRFGEQLEHDNRGSKSAADVQAVQRTLPSTTETISSRIASPFISNIYYKSSEYASGDSGEVDHDAEGAALQNGASPSTDEQCAVQRTAPDLQSPLQSATMKSTRSFTFDTHGADVSASTGQIDSAHVANASFQNGQGSYEGLPHREQRLSGEHGDGKGAGSSPSLPLPPHAQRTDQMQWNDSSQWDLGTSPQDTYLQRQSSISTCDDEGGVFGASVELQAGQQHGRGSTKQPGVFSYPLSVSGQIGFQSRSHSIPIIDCTTNMPIQHSVSSQDNATSHTSAQNSTVAEHHDGADDDVSDALSRDVLGALDACADSDVQSRKQTRRSSALGTRQSSLSIPIEEPDTPTFNVVHTGAGRGKGRVVRGQVAEGGFGGASVGNEYGQSSPVRYGGQSEPEHGYSNSHKATFSSANNTQHNKYSGSRLVASPEGAMRKARSVGQGFKVRSTSQYLDGEGGEFDGEMLYDDDATWLSLLQHTALQRGYNNSSPQYGGAWLEHASLELLDDVSHNEDVWVLFNDKSVRYVEYEEVCRLYGESKVPAMLVYVEHAAADAASTTATSHHKQAAPKQRAESSELCTPQAKARDMFPQLQLISEADFRQLCAEDYARQSPVCANNNQTTCVPDPPPRQQPNSKSQSTTTKVPAPAAPPPNKLPPPPPAPPPLPLPPPPALDSRDCPALLPLQWPQERPVSGQLFAIDTEMVALYRRNRQHSPTNKRFSIARVSVVRGCGPRVGIPCIDDYVPQVEAVADYLTQFSGIVESDLNPNTSTRCLTTEKRAQLKVLHLVGQGCVLVGHGLCNDFDVLNIHVPKSQRIDTSELFWFKRNRKMSLRFLAAVVLNKDIQQDTHDSIEDAVVALQLYHQYQIIAAAGKRIETLKYLYRLGRKVNWDPVQARMLATKAHGRKGGNKQQSTSTRHVQQQQHTAKANERS